MINIEEETEAEAELLKLSVGKTKEEAIAEKDRRAIEMEDMDNIELF